MSESISVHNIRKVNGDTTVFNEFNFEAETEKITSIFGPNGSGKTTLLNLIAGVSTPAEGNIELGNYDKSDISYIFQDYRRSLFPWRTNFENIAYPLELQQKNEKEIKSNFEEIKELLDLDIDWWEGHPGDLSGGQQQILAFIRALITYPKLLLIDEPFSALDFENSVKLRNLLQKYYLKYEPTVIMVTHDIEESIYLSNKVSVLSHKPTKILDTVENPLTYPRTMDSVNEEEFHKTKEKILSVFETNKKS
ncbi:MAG: ABC transporter ATP-binding protein [Candidatus Magasanikbacteria bacterium]